MLGGSGNDVLTGNASDNLLAGGLGSDELNGLAGFDTVDYSERTICVTVDLDGAPADDGEAGEGDTVAADVEAVRGGSGTMSSPETPATTFSTVVPAAIR